MDDSVEFASQRAEARAPYQPLVIVFAALAAGIVADRYGCPQVSIWRDGAAGSTFRVIGLLIWALGLLGAWWVTRRRKCDWLAAWPLLMAVASTGAAWHDLQWHTYGRHEIARYADDAPIPVCVEVIARETPERVSAPRPTPLRAIPGGEQSRLPVELVRIRDGSQWRPATGYSQLTVPGHLLGVHAGDRLQVFGQLARSSSPLNPGEFDFAAHARADRQIASLRSTAPECVSKLASAAVWTPRALVDLIRVHSKRIVRKFVGPERSALAAAILLGAREGLPYDETEPYLVTGTIHVLVVSGMNLAILASGLVVMMRCGLVSRRLGLAVTVVVVTFYAMLAESQPPVVRAAALAVLLCVAAWTGRRGVAFNSLFGAAILVVALNPCDLFRVGPQLSFLAVASLIWVGQIVVERRQLVDRLDQLIAESRPWYWKAQHVVMIWTGWLLVTSLVVWLVALPLVLQQFHVVSSVSVPLNLLVWPVVFAAMWSGAAMLLLGWIAPPVGTFFGTICSWSLGLLEGSVRVAEAIPNPGHFWAPGPAWWWVAVFYLGLLASMIWRHSLPHWKWQLSALCVWIMIGLTPPLVRHWTRDSFECSFVAVGHGTCVVLEAPTGETLLYDAGALGSPEYATQTIASYLWDRGIMRIDGIIVSHADIDHFNAVPGLVERFAVGAVYVSPVMFDEFGENTSGAPLVFRQAIQDAGVPIREVWAGDRLRAGPEVLIDILHPPRRGVVGNDNANSLTLAIKYKDRRLLLPGDLESPGLDDVMAELPHDCDIVMAPHHGSRLSDPPGFAAWSTPEWVIISGARGEDVEPVRQTYQSAGAVVLATSRHGAVRFTLQEAAPLRVSSWLNPLP
jgi:competence protein ComEC